MISGLVRAAEHLGELDPRAIPRAEILDAHAALERVRSMVEGAAAAVLAVIDADQVYADEVRDRGDVYRHVATHAAGRRERAGATSTPVARWWAISCPTADTTCFLPTWANAS